jgi:hypothetical protein
MDAGHGAGRSAVDGPEPGVGVGAPDEGRVQDAGQLYVIDELTPPGEEGGVLKARDSCAEVLRAHPQVLSTTISRRVFTIRAITS